MDVGIDIHNLRGTGRLSAVARALRVSEFEALGMLTIAWAETQHRELVCVSAREFHDATAIHFDDPGAVLEAMARAKLATHDAESNTWQIHGNEKHVIKLKAYRANASLGGKALAAKRHAIRHSQNTPSTQKAVPNGMPLGSQTARPLESKRHASWIPNGMPFGIQTDALDILDTGTRDPDLSASHFSPASNTEHDPRSLWPSDAKKTVGLTPSPSAPVVQEKAKRKERSEEQKARGLANNRLYRELYETADGHPPSGLDQAFSGMMAKFSDKYADDAAAILEWAFRTPDRSFRNKGWPLDYIVSQAPRLWRELNDPTRAVENIAAPRQQHQMALAASNDLAFNEYQRRKAERLANANNKV